MRNLVVLLHTSLDGYVEGPNGAMDIGFISYDSSLEKFANETLSTADTVLWGRHTYNMMHDYWPTMLNNPDVSEHERHHAKWINAIPKVICSNTLTDVTWHNSTLISGDITEKIRHLKHQDGQDIVVIGSPRLAQFLLHEKLVDKLGLTISPVLVGSGLRLFDKVESDLELIKSETFDSGVLAVNYRVLSK